MRAGVGSEGRDSGSEVGAGTPRKPTYSLGLLVPEPSGTECRNRRCQRFAYSRPCACVSCIAAKSKPSHSRHSPVSPACVCARNIFLAHFFRIPSTKKVLLRQYFEYSRSGDGSCEVPQVSLTGFRIKQGSEMFPKGQ